VFNRIGFTRIDKSNPLYSPSQLAERNSFLPKYAFNIASILNQIVFIFLMMSRATF